MTADFVAQETITADVIIIGSGVVGSLMSWSLSKAGLNVAVIEAGAPVDRVAAIDKFKQSPKKEANSPYAMMPWAPVPSDSNPFDYYVQPGHESKDPKIQAAFGGFFMRLVGGTSWHWTGHAERMFPNDFRTRTMYGHGEDWPITYDELQPYYIRVEDTWGVAGDASCTAPPRDTGYPMPVVPRSYLDVQLGKAGLAAVGVDSSPVPHCRNSLPHAGRPQCCGNSSCLPICPIGAKYDASVHVGLAQALGTRVMANRVAVQVEVGDGGTVTGIWYRNFDNGAGGILGVARAKVFVLAAHAVETPRLMLLSAGRLGVPAHGLANSSDQVGRNLMGFGNTDTMGYSPKDNPVYPYRGPVSATGNFGAWRDGEFRKERASIALFIPNGGFTPAIGPLAEAQAAIAGGLMGTALKDRIDDRVKRQTHLHGTIEVMADADNRITLATHEKDPLGLPRPKVNYRLDDYTLKGARFAFDTQLAILKAMAVETPGCAPVDPTDRNFEKFIRNELDPRYYGFSTGDAVIAGTVRMGADPKRAVVDPHCRSFDNPNLFVVGTCNYLTTGSASPSLTAAALALRAADHIADTFRAG